MIRVITFKNVILSWFYSIQVHALSSAIYYFIIAGPCKATASWTSASTSAETRKETPSSIPHSNTATSSKAHKCLNQSRKPLKITRIDSLRRLHRSQFAGKT